LSNPTVSYEPLHHKYRTQTFADLVGQEAIAPHLQNWVAGCDICQAVCPWNERFAQETDVPDFQPYPENVAPSLTELAQLSEQALRRIRPDMMRRNAKASLPETLS
jgi:epoxyqueuosine reductase